MTVLNNNAHRYSVLFGFTPIAENKTRVWITTYSKKKSNILLNILEYVFWILQAKYTYGQDIEVLNTMNPNGGGAYINYDLPPLKMREFYQSWVGKVS